MKTQTMRKQPTATKTTKKKTTKKTTKKTAKKEHDPRPTVELNDLRIEREDLHAALRYLRWVPDSGSSEQLIHVQADGDLRLTVVGKEVGARVCLPGRGSAPLSIPFDVNAEILRDLIAEVPIRSSVRLTTQDSVLALLFRANPLFAPTQDIPSLDVSIQTQAAGASKWPVLDGPQKEILRGKMGPEQLDTIRCVARFASEDPTQIHLNSILIEHDGDHTWTALATNGHRMMIAESSGPFPKPLTVQVSPSIVTLLPVTPAHATFHRRFAFFNSIHASGKRCFSKTSLAVFPPWRKSIPSTFTPDCDRVRTSRSNLSTILKTFRSFHEGRDPVLLELLDDRISLTTPRDGLERPVGRAELPAIHKMSGLSPIGLNPSYLYDAVDAVGGDDAFLWWTGKLDAFVVSNEDRTRICVVMPMRIGE